MIGVQTATVARTTSRRKLDWPLLIAAGLLLFLGLTSLYSLDASRDTTFFKRQVMFAVIGIVPFTVFLLVEPAFWRRIWKWLYGINVGMLLLVAFAGSTGKGAERWIDLGPVQFQPSELSKLLLVLTLAAYFADRQDRVRSLGTFFGSLLHMLPIFVLVFLQPHLGAALTLGVAWLAVGVYAGVRWRFVGATGALALTALLVAAFVPGVLQDYQKERFFGHFFGSDPKGAGYQAEQAQIAFGAGGLAGKGYQQGERKRDGYIPEQENDFVATILGEEGGFVGMSILVLAFGFLFFRIWLIGFASADVFGRMVAGGLLAILGFHTMVNLGMNLGLTPVVGLWLPFMSAGGTALLFCMAAIGLLARLRIMDEERFFRM